MPVMRSSVPWQRVVATGAAGALLLALLATDEATLQLLGGHRTLWLDRLSDGVVLFGSDAAPLVVPGLLLLLGVALDRSRLRAGAVSALLAALLAGAIVLIAKPLIGRQNALVYTPHDAQAPWLVRHWGHFPSGHAAVAFSLAASLGAASRRSHPGCMRWPRWSA